MKSGMAWSRSTGSWTPTTCPFASRSQRLSESGVWELPFATFVQACCVTKIGHSVSEGAELSLGVWLFPFGMLLMCAFGNSPGRWKFSPWQSFSYFHVTFEKRGSRLPVHLVLQTSGVWVEGALSVVSLLLHSRIRWRGLSGQGS
jgi:hypothetical protein